MNGVLNMGEVRKHHNIEFKEETVKYILQHRKSLPDIAAELNISESTLRGWVGKYRKYEDEPFVGSGNLREPDRLSKRKTNELKISKRRLKS
jgi:transposase